jgi:hypothetical protein
MEASEMTLILEIPKAEETAWEAEAERLGLTLADFTRQAIMEKLIAGLKHQRIPQSLDEIKPRRLPPTGKTAMQMVVGQWPGDETDEELQAALKAMG